MPPHLSSLPSDEMLPPRRRATSKNCPCGEDKSIHISLCWFFHLLFVMGITCCFVMGLLWLFGRPAYSQPAICSVCECIGTKLLCADRDFTYIPKIEDSEFISSLTILGVQRNRIKTVSGRYLSRFSSLLLLDIRNQEHKGCVEPVDFPVPDNIIIRGKHSFLSSLTHLSAIYVFFSWSL